jgi:hypothetical protein
MKGKAYARNSHVADWYTTPHHHYLTASNVNYNLKGIIIMNQIIYLVGLIVVIMAILSFVGLA